MSAWLAPLLYAPVSLVRAVAGWLREGLKPSGAREQASIDRREASAREAPSAEQDFKMELVATLLNRVRDGLTGHSDELATFTRALVPASGESLPLAPREKMQRANQSLEELVDRTVDRLAQTCGSLLSEEQARLEVYQQQTNAFSKRLDAVPSELVLTHAVAELLAMVSHLREENEAVRSEVAEGQKKVCQLISRATTAEREARVDVLTQLLNRRAFDEIHLKCHANILQQPYCLVLLDVDHFKSVNDRYGHTAGDAVLSLVGKVIRDNCKATDYCSRWGGEEFAILLPVCGEEVALGVAERLRRKIESAVLYIGPYEIAVTVSCGIAQSHHDRTKDQILKDVDTALYAAKKQGRNRSFVYGKGCRGLTWSAASTAT